MNNEQVGNTSVNTSGPRDVFTHLLSVLWLYVSVFSLGTLLFSLIEIWFPDATAPYWMPYGAQQAAIRWIVAVLTIVFPMYVYSVIRLERDLVVTPEKRNLKTRRWSYNFTLFLTSVVIVIDIITALYTFLNGELTTRFICKVLSVLLIAAAVFVYYRWSLRSDTSLKATPSMRYFALAVVALVSVAIIAGYTYAGSPKSERMRRIDDERSSNLQVIQSQVLSYWQTKGSLPTDLTKLEDDISGWKAPVDPESKKAYEYRVTAARSFELCAVFTTEQLQNTQTVPYYGFEEGNWLHQVGHVCFSRAVDPDRYPVNPKVAPVIKK